MISNRSKFALLTVIWLLLPLCNTNKVNCKKLAILPYSKVNRKALTLRQQTRQSSRIGGK